MNAPKVVVGIATRNRAELLRKSLRSVQAQICSTRIHVFDDASRDDTSKLQKEFPDVTWERTEAPVGILRARNQMMAAASEQFFVSLDDDAWFLRGDEIELAVQFLEKNPSAGAVAFDILSPDRPTQIDRGSFEPAAIFVGCGHVLRLEAVRRVRGYEHFPGHYGGEERDLCLKLMDAGFEIVSSPGVHVWHEKTLTARDFQWQHRSGVCNDFASVVVRYPRHLIVPRLVRKLVAHGWFGIRNGLTKAAFAGLIDFSRQLQPLWKIRRPVSRETMSRFESLSDQSRPTSIATWKQAAKNVERNGDG